MSMSENQIFVYQPNETIRLGVRLENEVQTNEPPLQSIFYQNQFWDAKSLLIKFIRRAKKELIVIDAYPGVANGECCHCVNVAVTAPCGGSQPLGTRTRRAKREPSGQFQFPIEEAA